MTCSIYQYVIVLVLTCNSTPRIKIATAICAEPCEAANHSPAAILHDLIQPIAVEAQFAAALPHDDLRPISLLSHAQKRIHIGNHGIPLLHDDARSPCLLPRHDYSVYQCSTPRIKIATAICAEPCEAANHSPAAILHDLIQPIAVEAQFAAALPHDDLRPISLLSHAQKRIHIGNHGIPLLHDDARSPCLLPRHDYSVYQCVIVLVLTYGRGLCVLV
ncbi:hypothetical protein C4D60_Mb06t30000 [Musa balbisiana]|uniref:Uncharacterized protein n=1 Tax=Musa balbisiana TaxID=52838 RepID=A0A4S8IRP8_MUSBA|nr:hypothetical protein C4D60_Mb06t30000 [Musa balbisiana]